jgi:hypothetical protein
MQPEGPYTFTELVGRCPVGAVWSAEDEYGRLLTVAVLEPAAAGDAGWRQAFEAAAQTMAQPQTGDMPYVNADFAAQIPWVAYSVGRGPGAERLFQSLGMVLQPVPGAPQADSTGPASSPVSGASTSGGPTSGASAPGTPVSGAPASVPPYPVSGAGASGPPVSGPPVSGAPSSGPPLGSRPNLPGSPSPTSGGPLAAWAPVSETGDRQPGADRARPSGDLRSYDPLDAQANRVRFAETPPPRGRRRGLWIGVGVLVLALLASAGGLVAWARSGSGGKQDTAAGTASPSALPPAPPATAPQSPGIEPPKAGGWPKDWPKFTPQDSIRTFADLEGLGFALKVPAEWDCTPAARAQGFVKYYCGVSNGRTQMGGEVIVRDCPLPCNEERQVAMRRAEEAWGLQWNRGGQYATYADSSRLQIDGERRYGLVVVAYWRGGNTGRVDHQLVLRMTSPIDGAGRLRRVANHVRETLIF